MKELSKIGWMVLAAPLIACGGATQSPASPDPSPVSHVIVPAAPPSASNVVEEPEASNGEESEAESPPQPVEAPAQPRPSEATITAARALFQTGVAAYQQGRYGDARDAFLAAHQMVPKPQILFNLATAEMQLGNVKDACAHFEAWMNEASPSATQVGNVAPQLQKCGILP